MGAEGEAIRRIISRIFHTSLPENKETISINIFRREENQI
jgi:hypothetical protein